MEARLAKDKADRAIEDAVKAAATAPPNLVQDVNGAFRAAYRSARQDALAAAGPVVVVSGDALVLIRSGKRQSVTAVPPLYHDLKVHGHIPLAAYLLTRPGTKPTFDDDRRAEITLFLNRVESARNNPGSVKLSDDQRRRQQTVFDETIAYLRDADQAQTVTPAARTAFARKMAPLVLAHAADAARAQIDGLHQQMAAWKRDFTADEWTQLKVVVMGSQMPRVGNVAVQYFAWLLGEPGEGKRIMYAEGIFDETKALNLLGTHQVDTDIAASFFAEERRMHRDLLADAAKEILKGMKP
jgi:hypothetical protein